nr:STAS domain-containing protein [Actinomadura coerulea]
MVRQPGGTHLGSSPTQRIVEAITSDKHLTARHDHAHPCCGGLAGGPASAIVVGRKLFAGRFRPKQNTRGEPPVSPLEVTTRPDGGRAVIRLCGELDVAGSQELRVRLDEARREHGDHLVLDLTDLEFMDSGGLSVIVACYKAATAAGGSLVLAGPRPIVRRALEITGLHRRIPVKRTLQEALAVEPDRG